MIDEKIDIALRYSELFGIYAVTLLILIIIFCITILFFTGNDDFEELPKIIKLILRIFYIIDAFLILICGIYLTYAKTLEILYK